MFQKILDWGYLYSLYFEILQIILFELFNAPHFIDENLHENFLLIDNFFEI